MTPALRTFLSRLTSTAGLWLAAGSIMATAYEPGFWALLVILPFIGTREYFRALDAAKLPHNGRLALALGTVLILGDLFLTQKHGQNAALLFDVVFVSFSILAVFFRRLAIQFRIEDSLHAVALTVFGILYAPLLFSFFGKILYIVPRNPDGSLAGHYYLLFLCITTKFSDFGAYITGSLVGKTPMIPHVSPKKTMEGFAGALAFSALGAWGLIALFPERLSLLNPGIAITLGTFFGFVAVIGDLAESLIKRATGIKDSGSMLPGIGGALDLIDSLLFTAPLLYAYLVYATRPA